jgi:hypothetical protein
MECPVCQNKTRVELDTHADGYAENLQECGECGALWITKGQRSVLVHGATQTEVVHREMAC